MMKEQMRYIMGVLLIAIFPLLLQAQPHNGEVYRQLMDQYFQENALPFGSIEGSYPERYFSQVSPDSSADAVLQIAPAIVRYKQLADSLHVRTVDITVVRKDSTSETFTYRYADTLSNVNLRRVIRKSPDDLRGDNPLPGAKWIRPIALISLSITGLISLFFLRSG